MLPLYFTRLFLATVELLLGLHSCLLQILENPSWTRLQPHYRFLKNLPVLHRNGPNFNHCDECDPIGAHVPFALYTKQTIKLFPF